MKGEELRIIAKSEKSNFKRPCRRVKFEIEVSDVKIWLEAKTLSNLGQRPKIRNTLPVFAWKAIP